MNTRSSGFSVALACSAGIALLALASTAGAQPKAALVRDVDRSSSQPVHGYCVAPSSGGAAKCTLLTVPAGKRLVVETVTYSILGEPGKRIIDILIGDGTEFSSAPVLDFNDNVYALPPVFSNNYGVNRYATTQPLKMVLDEGRILVGYVGSESSLSYSQQFGFSGFLVDK